MIDPATTLILSTTTLLAIAMLMVGGLKGLQAWIDLRKAELGTQSQADTPPSSLNRIELADLKERLKKLEALAADQRAG
jgi:hypothetical protein